MYVLIFVHDNCLYKFKWGWKAQSNFKQKLDDEILRHKIVLHRYTFFTKFGKKDTSELNQTNYFMGILKRLGMQECKPISTLMNSNFISNCYVGSDWSGDIIDKKSTTGYIF